MVLEILAETVFVLFVWFIKGIASRMTHEALVARPPSGGRLDHEIESLRLRLQRLQHDVAERDKFGQRPHQADDTTKQQLMMYASSPRQPKLSDVVRDKREEQRRAIASARQELAESRRDGALAQKYEKKILSCQREINKHELLAEVRSLREQWRSEKHHLVSQRHEQLCERVSSARSQRNQLQRLQTERETRLLHEREDLEAQVRQLQQQLHN
jgi:hypothetical protein